MFGTSYLATLIRQGILKADWGARSYEHKARSVRIDDIVQVAVGVDRESATVACAEACLPSHRAHRALPPQRDVCMLKADVEGYEAQVLQTASRLLARYRVPTVQLELTKTPKEKNQT